MNETKPKRRWFRFSLRTLFVMVTMFALALGYQLNWIRNRHEFLKLPKVVQLNRPPPGTSAPVLLRILNESGVSIVEVDGKAERDRAQELFPEAEIIINPEGSFQTPHAPLPPPPSSP